MLKGNEKMDLFIGSMLDDKTKLRHAKQAIEELTKENEELQKQVNNNALLAGVVFNEAESVVEVCEHKQAYYHNDGDIELYCPDCDEYFEQT